MTAVDSFGILLQASFKAAVLLGLAGVVALALRRGSGHLRHLVWSSALGGALLLPLASSWVPAWHLGWLPFPAGGAVDPASEPALPEAATSLPGELTAVSVPDRRTGPPAEAASATGTAAVRRPPSEEELCLGLWLLGSLAVLGRLLWGLWRLACLAHVSRAPSGAAWPELLRELAARLRLRRPVRLLESSGVCAPMTCGVLRPAVFIPPQAAGWSAERRRVVLLHELVHVSRGDALVQICAELCCALYWWNPLVWLARRRLHVEREAACDETVIDLGTKPSAYATHLLEIASSLTGRAHALPVAALTMIQRSQLEGRLMSILTTRPRRSGTALAGLTTLLMACLILAVTAADLRGSPPDAGENEDKRSKSVTWMNGNGDDVRIERQFGDLDFYARARDGVRFADDGSVDSLEPGSSLVLEAAWQGVEARLRITPGDDGQPRYALTVGGEERELDAAARSWTDGMLAAFHDVMEVSERRGEISRLRGKISGIRGEQSRLRGKISSIRGEQSQMRGQISGIRGEQSRMRGKISRVRGEESRMRGEISALRGEQSRLRGDLSRLRADLAALRRMERFEDEMTPEEKSRHEERVNRRKVEMQEIEDRIAGHDLAGQIAEIEGRIRDFDAEGKIAKINAEMAGQNVAGRIAEVEQQIAGLGVDGRIGEINAEIAGLDVDGRIGEINAEIEKVQKDLEPHLDKVESHSDELRRLTSSLER